MLGDGLRACAKSFLKIAVRSVPTLASLSALRSATPSWLLMFGSRSAKLAHKCRLVPSGLV